MDVLHMNSALGTKWFTFYAKCRPWFILIASLATVNDFIQYSEIYLSYWWMMLLLVSTAAQVILSIIVFVKSRGDYIEFVRFVKGVLLFETISFAYGQGVQQYAKHEFDFFIAFITSTLIFFILFFVWYRLNLKYFTKRIISPIHTTAPSEYPNPKKSSEEKAGISEVENDKKLDLLLNMLAAQKQSGQIIEKSENVSKDNINEATAPTISEQPLIKNGYHAAPQASAIPDAFSAEIRPKFCRICGSKLSEDGLFCQMCGTKIAPLKSRAE